MALFLGLLGGLSSQHNNTWPWEKGLLKSLKSEWTCAAAGHAEWPQVLQLLQTMLCQHRAHTHTHKKQAHRPAVPFHRSLSLSYLYSGFVSSNWSWWGTNWQLFLQHPLLKQWQTMGGNMSRVNERLQKNKSLKTGLFHRTGRKRKLRIFFVSFTSFAHHVQVSEKKR